MKSLVLFLSLLVYSCTVKGAFLKSRLLNECNTFTGCFLVNLKSKGETLLSDSTQNIYTLDNTNDWGYSIRCDVNRGLGESNYITFFYDERTFTEWGYPSYMNGNAHEGKYIIPVPYLSTCGKKQLKVEGHIWTAMCFHQTYNIEAINPMNATCDPNTLAIPIKAPTMFPMIAPAVMPANVPIQQQIIPMVPVKPPTTAPSRQLTKAPTKPAAIEPIKPSTNVPSSTPIVIPVQAPSDTIKLPVPFQVPNTSPVYVPFHPSVPKPVTPPGKVFVPLQVPTVATVKTAHASIPIQVPILSTINVPVIPIRMNEEVAVPQAARIPIPKPVLLHVSGPLKLYSNGKMKASKQKMVKRTKSADVNGGLVTRFQGGTSKTKKMKL